MDWQARINEIIEWGMCLSAIHEETGIPLSTLSEIKTGKTKDMYWARGESLNRLHRKMERKHKRAA